MATLKEIEKAKTKCFERNRNEFLSGIIKIMKRIDKQRFGKAIDRARMAMEYDKRFFLKDEEKTDIIIECKKRKPDNAREACFLAYFCRTSIHTFFKINAFKYAWTEWGLYIEDGNTIQINGKYIKWEKIEKFTEFMIVIEENWNEVESSKSI